MLRIKSIGLFFIWNQTGPISNALRLYAIWLFLFDWNTLLYALLSYFTTNGRSPLSSLSTPLFPFIFFCFLLFSCSSYFHLSTWSQLNLYTMWYDTILLTWLVFPVEWRQHSEQLIRDERSEIPLELPHTPCMKRWQWGKSRSRTKGRGRGEGEGEG